MTSPKFLKLLVTLLLANMSGFKDTSVQFECNPAKQAGILNLTTPLQNCNLIFCSASYTYVLIKMLFKSTQSVPAILISLYRHQRLAGKKKYITVCCMESLYSPTCGSHQFTLLFNRNLIKQQLPRLHFLPASYSYSKLSVSTTALTLQEMNCHKKL